MHYGGEQTLVIHRKIGDRRGDDNALGNLCLTCESLDEPEKAAAPLRQANAIGERIRNPQIVRVTTAALERLEA